MKVFKSSVSLRKYLDNLQTGDQRLTVGFVPTMGALHQGHLSLIDASRSENDITVCSIFVNPTQFGDVKDLETYPKPIERDLDLLIEHECDILFLPEAEDIYPIGHHHKTYDLNGLDKIIEGEQRPGHFQGVCNVLDRFFSIVKPQRAYFGQKDFQQTVVVRKLVSLLGLNIELRIMPISREPHGLAMSSRNSRLDPEAFQKARFIHDTLADIDRNKDSIGLEHALDNAAKMLSTQDGATLEYLTVVNANTLEPEFTNTDPKVVLVVVNYRGVRLLDNLLIQ